MRERLGLKQEKFGKALGIARSSINRYESGRHKQIKFTIARMKRLQKLLKANGMSICDLPDDID